MIVYFSYKYLNLLMKKSKSINLRKIIEKNRYGKNSFYDKGEEEVLKLDINDDINNKIYNINNSIILNFKENIPKKIEGETSFRFFSKNNDNNLLKEKISKNSSKILENVNKEYSSLNDISNSIKTLQTIIPNLNEKINVDNSYKISAPKIQNMKYESYLKNILNDLDKKEEKIKKRRMSLEKNFKSIDESIYDKQMNIDILVNMKSFKKMYKQKIINHFEKEFNRKEGEQNMEFDINNLRYSFSKEINKINQLKNKIDDYEISYPIKRSYSTILFKKGKKKSGQDNINSKKLDKIQHILRNKVFRAKLNNFILSNEYKSKMKAEELEKEVNQHKINKNLISQELEKLNKKLKSLHYIQKNIKEKLYTHYLRLLKDASDTRDEGLSWIVYEILNLGKNVLMSYMPKYLDEKCVKFILDKAHLIMKIKLLEKKYNESKKFFIKKLKKNKFIMKEMFDKRDLMKSLDNNQKDISFNILKLSDNSQIIKRNNMQKNVSAIFLKHKNLITKDNNISKNEFPLYIEGIQGDPNHYHIYNKKYEEYNTKEIKVKDGEIYNIKNDNLLKENQIVKLNDCFLLNKQMEELKRNKEDLKNKEMDRIFIEYQKNKYYERYNVDKNEVIKALVGEENLMHEIYYQNKKDKQFNDEILKTRFFKKVYNKNLLLLKHYKNFNSNSNSETNIKKLFQQKLINNKSLIVNKNNNLNVTSSLALENSVI